MSTLQQTLRIVAEDELMDMRGHPTARLLVLLSSTVAAAASAQQEPTPSAPPPAQQEATPPAKQEEPPASERVQVIGVSPVPGVNVPKDRIPANAQSARAAEIERSQALDLTQFMNRRLGSVSVNEVQNNPFQPDVSYRGFTASPLLGAPQGLSLYFDGVRMNQPFGDVVSWDLIPKSAIASLALNPGSNPLFGLNTLGGALVIQTKDGIKFPGSSVQVLGGSYGRVQAEFETGGSRDDGMHWYVTGNKFHEQGWRVDSPTDVGQLFAKVGRRAGDTDLWLSLSAANTDLNGNALQEQRFLARDYASVYTKPDNTQNRSLLLNLGLNQGLSQQWSLSGNLYYRKIKTATTSADINDDSLDQNVYQPNAAEQAALTAAGYTGFPTAGENAGNTPFPKWRCIANALLLDEPAEKCNGTINQTNTDQSQYGVAAQLNFDGKLLGLNSQSFVGGAIDASRSRFTQGSQLGYLNPDRSVTGVDAFGDGVNGGTVDGEPYDTRVDLSGHTQTWSLYGSSITEVATGTYLTVSGRYNHTTVRNSDAIIPAGSPGSLSSDSVYARFNPAIGLTFTASNGLNAYVGYNQGSRTPSSIELGCADPENPCKLPNAFAGDPPLKQVVTTTFEAGLRGGAPSSFAWTVGVFRSVNKDDLLFVADNAAGFGYFKNFGKTRRQGIELGASAQLARGFTAGANYTFLDATFQSPEVIDGSGNSSNSSAIDGFPGIEGTINIQPGDHIPLVPRQILKLFADLDLGNAWQVGADVIAQSSAIARGNENGQHQPDGEFYLGPGHYPGYAFLNLRAEFRPNKALRLFGQVGNVFNTKYSTAAQLGATGFNDAGNFEARPFPANANGDFPVRNATFYGPGAPRTFSAGLQYWF